MLKEIILNNISKRLLVFTSKLNKNIINVSIILNIFIINNFISHII
jgi:hypothetical protein